MLLIQLKIGTVNIEKHKYQVAHFPLSGFLLNIFLSDDSLLESAPYVKADTWDEGVCNVWPPGVSKGEFGECSLRYFLSKESPKTYSFKLLPTFSTLLIEILEFELSFILSMSRCIEPNSLLLSRVTLYVTCGFFYFWLTSTWLPVKLSFSKTVSVMISFLIVTFSMMIFSEWMLFLCFAMCSTICFILAILVQYWQSEQICFS